MALGSGQLGAYHSAVRERGREDEHVIDTPNVRRDQFLRRGDVSTHSHQDMEGEKVSESPRGVRTELPVRRVDRLRLRPNARRPRFARQRRELPAAAQKSAPVNQKERTCRRHCLMRWQAGTRGSGSAARASD